MTPFDEIIIDGPVGGLVRLAQWGDGWMVFHRTSRGWESSDWFTSVDEACASVYPSLHSSHKAVQVLSVDRIDFYAKDELVFTSPVPDDDTCLLQAAGHLPWVLCLARKALA